MSGEIVEVNPKIVSNPELVNKDPYGDGWLIKIKTENAGELSDLLYVGEYKKLIGIEETQPK